MNKHKLKVGQQVYNFRGQKLEVINTSYLKKDEGCIICRILPMDDLKGDDWVGGLVMLDISNDVFVPVNKKTTVAAKKLRLAEDLFHIAKRELDDMWLDFLDD